MRPLPFAQRTPIWSGTELYDFGYLLGPSLQEHASLHGSVSHANIKTELPSKGLEGCARQAIKVI